MCPFDSFRRVWELKHQYLSSWGKRQNLEENLNKSHRICTVERSYFLNKMFIKTTSQIYPDLHENPAACQTTEAMVSENITSPGCEINATYFQETDSCCNRDLLTHSFCLYLVTVTSLCWIRSLNFAEKIEGIFVLLMLFQFLRFTRRGQ